MGQHLLLFVQFHVVLSYHHAVNHHHPPRGRRLIPPVEVGDLMVIRDCGAYAAVMGSNYLRRPLPPEVLVDGDAWRVTRRRQTLDDLLALED